MAVSSPPGTGAAFRGRLGFRAARGVPSALGAGGGDGGPSICGNGIRIIASLYPKLVLEARRVFTSYEALL